MKTKTTPEKISSTPAHEQPALLAPAKKAAQGASSCPPTSGCCSREEMIAEAAYFRAAGRGFVPGNEMSDWLQAEAEVERMLATSE